MNARTRPVRPAAVIGRLATRLRRDTAGIAAVEFALVLPVMLTLYLGTAEVAQAVAVWGKVTLTSRTASDLVAQYTKPVPEGDIDGLIWKAAVAVLSPYAPDKLSVVVTSVMFDDTKPVPKAFIGWSVARGVDVNGSTAKARGVRCLTVLDEATVPAGVRAPNKSVIMAEIKLPYTPSLGYNIVGTINFAQKTFMMPRGSDTLDYVTKSSIEYKGDCSDK